MLVGATIGAPLAVMNLYVGLKTGWVFGVALSSVLVAKSLRGLVALSPLEINCAQSTASSAGFATGNALVGAVPAVILLGANLPHWGWLCGWIALASAFGVAVAWWSHGRFVDDPQLTFPSASAAAELVASDVRRDRSWLLSLTASALVTALRDVWRTLPQALGTSVGVELSPLLAGAGALIGVRVTAALVIGGAAAQSLSPTTRAFVGAPLLVVHALLGALILSARAWQTRQALPRRLFLPLTVMVTTGAALAWLSHVMFAIPPVLSLIALALGVIFALVAARAVGETDVAPGAALSKLTQLASGAVLPQAPIATLMTSALSHAVTTASADAVNDLKCGRLLGADARRQLVAQALGIVPGALAAVAAFYWLVPDREALERFALPAAKQLQTVALVLQHGVSGLDTSARYGMMIGAVLALGLFLLERLRLPISAVGIGLGLLLPLAASMTMLTGALVSLLVARRAPHRLLPVAMGAMVGESVVASAAAVLTRAT